MKARDFSQQAREDSRSKVVMQGGTLPTRLPTEIKGTFAPLSPGAGVFVRKGTATLNMFTVLAKFHGNATCIMSSFSSSLIPQSDGTYFS